MVGDSTQKILELIKPYLLEKSFYAEDVKLYKKRQPQPYFITIEEFEWKPIGENYYL